MQRKAILLCCLFLISSFRLFSQEESEFLPRGNFFEEAASPELAHAVTVPLSKIPQRIHSSKADMEEEEIRNAGELELEYKTVRLPKITAGAPRASLQDDRTAAAQRIVPPSLLTKFNGIECTGRTTPDSIIAVGPTRVLLAVNPQFAIFTKTGAKRFQTDFHTWFSSLKEAEDSNIFDPRLLYDTYEQHYIFICTARRGDHRSWILMSVSKTSDPEGEWAFWALDMQLNGKRRVDLWADFPRIGLDATGIYLAADMTTYNTFKFRYNKIRVLKKSEVYAFGDVSWHDFWKMTDASGYLARHVEPAQSFGKTDAEYLINTRPDEGNLITFWTITYNAKLKPQLAKKAVAVADYVTATVAPQKGGGTVLVAATEGSSALKVISRNGFVYASHAIAHDWGTGPLSAIRFYQLDTSGNLVQQITYGSKYSYYYMPTLAVNNTGDVVLAFNKSNDSTYAGIYFAGKKASDPGHRFSRSVVLHKGVANYNVPFPGSNIDHWGDYNGIAVAPDDTIWIFGEYALKSDTWGAHVGQVSY